MAVIPIPPAVHIEIKPFPPPLSLSNLDNVATILAPVAANGCPIARLPPFTLSLL